MHSLSSWRPLSFTYSGDGNAECDSADNDFLHIQASFFSVRRAAFFVWRSLLLRFDFLRRS